MQASGKVRADLSEWGEGPDRGAFLYVHNEGQEETTTEIKLRAVYTSAEPWFTVGHAEIRPTDRKEPATTRLTVQMQAGDIQVFRLT